MKIITNITSLILLTLCLQINAAALPGNTSEPGPDGLVARCAFLTKNNVVKASTQMANQFSTVYGVSLFEACTPAMIAKIKAIQAFVSNPANFNYGSFTPVAAKDFVNLVGDSANLFTGNLFPKFGGLSYYDLAKNKLETELLKQTNDVNFQTAALRNIATSLDTLGASTGGTKEINSKTIRAIVAEVQRIDTGEKEARDFLNSLSLKWERRKFYKAVTTKEGKLRALYKLPLNQYIQTTFARRLQNIVRLNSTTIPTLIPLIENPAAPLTTDLLNPEITAIPTDYSATEKQANAVIGAMADQIKATNMLVDAVALPAGTALPTGPLSNRVKDALEQTTIATVEPLLNIKSLVGILPTATPSALTIANATAATIKLTDQSVVNAAKLIPYTLTKTTLNDRTQELIDQLQKKAKGWFGGSLSAADREKIVQEGRMEVIDHLINPNEWKAANGDTIFGARKLNINVFNVKDETMKYIQDNTEENRIISVGKFMRQSLVFTQGMATLTKLTPPKGMTEWATFTELTNAMTTEITKWKAAATGGAAPAAAGTFTQGDIDAAVEKKTQDLSNNLITITDLNNLTYLPNTPTAPSRIGTVTSYLKKCAQAANALGLLGELAEEKIPYTDMEDLINKSVKAIKAKLSATPPAPVPAAISLKTDLDKIAELQKQLVEAKAAAVPAAAIDPAIIDAHNISVGKAVIAFNIAKTADIKTKISTGAYSWITQLNTAAKAINAITPGAKVITFLTNKLDNDGIALTVKTQADITDTTQAVAK